MENTDFLAMADKYKDMVYRIALNYYRNPADADDTVQDVLIKLYTAERQFQSEAHLRNWLIRVTINECKNVLRTPWKRWTVSWEDIAAAASFDSPQESELLFSVLNLPEKYRVVLYLFYYESLTAKEIGRLLNLQESAVTTRLSRAREMLKKKITEV